MKPIPNDLYEKIEKVSDNVRKTFLQRGIVIPVKNQDGSINIGRFRVENQHNGFYAVRNAQGEIVIDGINLPQTAALLANELALGRMVDNQIITQDRQYGYALFKETLYKQRSRNPNSDLVVFEVAKMKEAISKNRKEMFQKSIVQRFEKLRKLV
jgi:hypothetical protein